MRNCSVGRESDRATPSMPGQVSGDDGALPDFGRLRQAVEKVVRTWVRCIHLAEDVASEAVKRAWRKFGFSLPWRRLFGWTVWVAKHLLIVWHRATVRHRLAAAVDVDDLPALEVSKVDFNDCAAHALSRLAPGLHDTFRLLVAGATTEEIAKAHGLTDRGARKLVARLRGEMRALWN